jgi:crotonobetainyl-CoA:carnitine CoA-transferase CaiB-like acyl-CoA transferase
LQRADLGADVIKLEVPPRGDYQRQSPPHLNGVSAAYTALNRDKRSVCIDYRNPRGLAAFHALLSTADVFVESAIPGSLHKYGLDFPALTQRNPRLVYCSISGFGQDGTPLFYLMVATRSGVIAASWGAQLDQPWSPFKGKSKCPFDPARLRYCA